MKETSKIVLTFTVKNLGSLCEIMRVVVQLLLISLLFFINCLTKFLGLIILFLVI